MPNQIPFRLLALAMLAGVSVASAEAQPAPPPRGAQPIDGPESSMRGVVRQYLLAPRGEVDGLLLADGSEVKLPPHLSAQVVFAIRPGDAVTVTGYRPSAAPLIQAATVTNDASRASVRDDDPPGRGPDELVSGQVQTLLHAPMGETEGAVLADGTIVRLPSPEARRYEGVLQPGRTISVRGFVLRSPLGAVVEAMSIGDGPNGVTPVAGPPLAAPPGPGGPDALRPGAPPPPPPPGGFPPLPPGADPRPR